LVHPSFTVGQPTPRHLTIQEQHPNTVMVKKVCIVLLLVLTTSCGPKLQPKAMALPPLLPAGPTEHEIAYRAGLKAFRMATTEGYQQAAALFRQASELDQTSCEYALHLSEALLFLAQQEKSNWEDYSHSADEANAVINARSSAQECNAFESYLSRLRSLSL